VIVDGFVEPRDAMVTALMLDVQGFTDFAHRATAREAVDLLNELFAVTIPILEKHGCHVNKLLGDGVLGIFGAPEPLPDHADRAIEAAVEILAAIEGALGDRCCVGIGINSGLVLAGTMGAGTTWELGVIGDPVNVAARVEKATREIGEPMLVTEATHCLAERTAVGLEPRGTIAVRGKPDPIRVYAAARVGADPGARNDSRTQAP
jgi:adenylate cyclase